MADARINHQNARKYWQGLNADIDSMLGGFSYISDIDLKGSKSFLTTLNILSMNQKKKIERAVDCGAGIGRITEGLLLDIAITVDIVEPIAKFSDVLTGKKGLGQIFNVGLEDWTPTHKYDLIWNQWCLGYLTDPQLIVHLKNCSEALVSGGVIIVKENLSSSHIDIFDDLDNSVTRADENFVKLFELSGLRVERAEIQRGFPRELYPVKTYALVSNNLR